MAASVVALGDVVDFSSGGTPSKSRSSFWTGEIPWVSAKDMKSFRLHGAQDHISEEGLRSGSRLAAAGDVLLLTRGMTLLQDVPVCVAQVPMAFNQDVKALSARKGLDPSYLPYLVASLRSQLLALVDLAGHGTGRLSTPSLKSLEVRLPDLTEQRRIAHILSTLDDKIELNRRMSATLEEMSRALFKSWFVDFDPVRAKADGRDTGLSPHIADLFPDRLVDSQHGEFPTGWRWATLGDHLTVLETGARPKGGVANYVEGVPSVGAESIVGIGVHDFSKTKYVPEPYFVAMKRGHVQDGDVVLYKDGGRPGLFEPHVTLTGQGFPFGRFAINEHVYRLRATPDLGQEYLFYWLSSANAMDQMRVKGTGVAIPGLNQSAVRSLDLPLPPADVVGCFANHVRPMTSRILTAAVESRELAKTRDRLVGRLID